MVLSVFGGTITLTGSVAAAGAMGNVSVLSAEEYDGTIEIALEGTTDNGTELGNISLADNRTEVRVSNASGDFNLTASASIVGNNNGTDGVILIDVGRDIDPVETLEVNAENVTDGWQAVQVSGGVANLTAGSVGVSPDDLFRGTDIAIVNTSADDFTYEFQEDSSFVHEKKTGTNSSVRIVDTGDLSLDTTYSYHQISGGSSSNVSFTLASLDLTASASSTSVTTGNSVDINVDSSKVDRDIVIQLVDSDGTVVNETADTLDGNGEASATFTRNAAGDFTGKVIDAQSGVEDETNTITYSDPAEGTVSFENNNVEEHRGDIASITVNIENVDSASLVLGLEDESGYNANLTVTDGDDDDQVTVMFNTYEAGNRSGAGTPTAWADGDDDSVTVDSESEDLGGVLGTGSYVMLLATGDNNWDTAIDSRDVSGALTISPRSLDPGLTSYTGPTGVLGDLDSASSVATAIDDGTLVEGSDITQTEYGNQNFDALVYRFEASGVAGALYDGGISTTEFVDVLSAEQQNPTQNKAAKVLNLSDTEAGVTVHADLDADTYYVVVTPSDVSLERSSDNQGLSISTGETYDVDFAIDDDIGSSTTSTTASFRAGSTSLDFEGDTYGVVPDANATISGTTNVAPGTTYNIRIRALSAQSTFNLDQDVEVGADGTFSAEFDLADEPEGLEFDIEVRGPNGDTFVTADGQFVAPPSASVTFDDQISPGGAVVTVNEVTLSEGGFVAIHVNSPSGQIIGSSKILSAGTHENVRIALDQTLGSDGTLVAMPHFDEDRDSQFDPSVDGAYTADGAPVTDSAEITYAEASTDQEPETVTVTRTVTVIQDSPTPREVTRTVERTVEVTRTVERTVTRTVERTVTITQTDGQPGFGIALAVVALIAAALLAVRRRD